MIWYKIDVDAVFNDLSPTFFRDVNFSSFSTAYAIALQGLANKTLYQMQHNSSVVYLEKLLNEYFEVDDYDVLDHVGTRTIYITDAPQNEKDYIWQEEEPETMWLDVEDDDEFLDVSPEVYYHFIVNIPAAISFDELQLRALIDFYKLAGKKYIIKAY